MNILISGGTGFIGQHLCQYYLQRGAKVWVWTRSEKKASKLLPGVSVVSDLSELNAVDVWDAVVNLAGAPILGPWWTASRKQYLLESRVALTEQLVRYLSQRTVSPKVFISASAIGFYGAQGDNIIVETSPVTPGFQHELCQRWEAAALQIKSPDTRVCIMRLGVVLDRNGGMLQRMLPAFLCGLGGRLGSGKQWFSWIHLEDVLRVVEWLIEHNHQDGVFNTVAPDPVQNVVFTKTLSQIIKRPAWIPVPARLLKMLLGEQSELLLGSQRVMPDRLMAAGFTFSKSTITQALTK